MRISAHTTAKVVILVQFAALIRCLAEYFRLKWVLGSALTPARIEPFIVGALIAAVGALIAVVLYFLEKYSFTAITGTITIAVLLVLRFALF